MSAVWWKHTAFTALLLSAGGLSQQVPGCQGGECNHPADDGEDSSLLSLRALPKTSTSMSAAVKDAILGAGNALQTQQYQLVDCLLAELKDYNNIQSTPLQLSQIGYRWVNGSLADPENLWHMHNHYEGPDLMPVAVAFPADAKQVAQCVVCSLRVGLPVVAQSGRHAYQAYCKHGCLLVNVFKLKQVKIDSSKSLGTLGAGLNLGQVYTLLNDQHFTIPGGTCPTVGLAGLTLGGGKGILTRLHGMSIDKLAGIEAILSNGTRILADATQNQDLFWLARGGGGNSFPGVVTAFTFNLVRVPTVVTEFTGWWAFNNPRTGEADIEQGTKVFNLWQDRFLVHPDWRVYVRLELHPYGMNATSTSPYINLNFKFLGMEKSEADQYVQEAFRSIGYPDGPNVDAADEEKGHWSTMTYWQSLTMGGGIGQTGAKGCKSWNSPNPADRMTWEDAREEMLRAKPPFCSWDGQFNTNMKYRSLVMKRMSHAVVDRFLLNVAAAPFFGSPNANWQFYLMIDPSNGAAAEVGQLDTAYPWRGADEMTMQVVAKWDDSTSTHAYGKANTNPTLLGFNFMLIADLQPYVGTRSYYNYADENMPGGAIPLFSYFGPNANRVRSIVNKHSDWRFDPSSEWELKPRRNDAVGAVTDLPYLSDHPEGAQHYPKLTLKDSNDDSVASSSHRQFM